MDDQKIIIESLAMDLKRVALGLHRGSFNMANRFKEEANARIQELQKYPKNAYLEKLINKNIQAFRQDNKRLSEDSLMLSTLFQNYSQTL